MSGPSVTHYQQRARGVCALCLDLMSDEDDRLHHQWCDTLYRLGWRVTGIRALTFKERISHAYHRRSPEVVAATIAC